MTESLDALWDEMYRAIRLNRDGQLMIALRGRIEAASADNEGPPEPGIDVERLCGSRTWHRQRNHGGEWSDCRHETCRVFNAALADGDSPGGAE